MPHSLRLGVAGALVTYLALASIMAVTKRPWVDEAWFAIPALNLLTRGVMATTNLETAGTWLAGLDQYTYWIMPLHVIAQTAWYAIFGFGVVSMRALSIAWGLLALVSWYVIVVRLTAARRAATVVVCLLATDYIFIRGAGDGRMEMMNAALGYAGIAAYLSLRERSFARAVATSHVLVAASVLTHPNGVLAWSGLVALTLYFDRRRIRIRHVAVAAVPYLIGFGAWGLYIAQAPHFFLTQFGGNAADRPWEGPMTWVRTLADAYGAAFGFSSHWAGPAVHVRALVLIAYLTGIGGLLFTPSLRRQTGPRVLLMLFAIYFVLMPFLRSPNAHDYLVHIVPIYCAALGVWLTWTWERRALPRPIIATAAVGLMLLQAGGVALRAYSNTWARNYAPAIEFLKTHTRPDDVIMGSAELGFELGFTPRLIDDPRLGYYSGRHAEFFVVDDRYQIWIDDYPAKAPAVARHVTTLLSQSYEKVYERNTFVIYRCRRNGDLAHRSAAGTTAATDPLLSSSRHDR